MDTKKLKCPRCNKKTLQLNTLNNLYECQNKNCKAKGVSLADVKGLTLTYSEIAEILEKRKK